MNVPRAIDLWLPEALAELDAQDFAQIDLNDLLQEDPPYAAASGLECLQEVMRRIPRDLDVDGMLTIPLESAGTWEAPITTLEEIVGTAWTYGAGRSVPGLYLVRPPQWRGYEGVEEHRRPVATGQLPSRFVAYYRAWRANDETEYERCIYVRTMTNA